MNKFYRIILNPVMILKYFGRKLPWLFTDKQYVKILYRSVFKHKLNLKDPRTFNEKLQWLKLYDRCPEYTKMVDKALVKDYVTKIIGKEYIIQTIGVYDKVNDIDFEKLPNQFVMKCTHDSGGLVICKDKSRLDIMAAKQKITRCLKNNYFYTWREWPYKELKPRVIIEEYLEEENSNSLKDYKFFCFNGIPKAIFIATGRPYDTRFDFYDIDFRHLPFTNGHPNANKPILKPTNFYKMKELASKLSVNIPHVRVDFYEIKGQVYFGELTFFHWSGLVPFEPESWDYTFGNWINLPI